MKTLKQLFENNQKWAEKHLQQDPNFFKNLVAQQSPEYLWIGCADSRVPANEIVGLAPGELFVHRNVANIVNQNDPNCLSVIQYAVEVLKVKHIIVCGHYGCGGVQAAMQNQQLGLVTDWLKPIRALYQKNQSALDLIQNDSERLEKLCELNVREQAKQVSETSFVKTALKQGQPLFIHSWIYRLQDGILRDLSSP